MMALICPSCGSDSCIVPAHDIIDAAPTLYSKCTSCSDLLLEKNESLDLTGIDFEELRCRRCGKRPLDAVMAHVLALCAENTPNASLALREVGTPLLSPGVPTFAPPHLGPLNLVLLTYQKIVANAGAQILDHVSEVKGILFGDTRKVIGLKSLLTAPYTCHVIGGCDVRADLVSSAYGQIAIYKSQSNLHIEYDNRGKMHRLGTIPLAGCGVLDALSGPGTLGLMSVLMGARKVILNDAWLPAIKNACLNLYVNKEVLGIKTIQCDSTTASGPWKRDDPKLFCTATTDSANIELYHGSFERLNVEDLDVDILLIDPFPGMMPSFKHIAEQMSGALPGVQIFYF